MESTKKQKKTIMLNRAQIIGNLGDDPKVNISTNSQTSVASFSVATTEKGYTTKNGVQVPDKTEWHNVVCFGKLAEIVGKFLKKGSKVYVDGKMRTRSYEDKQGITRKVMEINAENMEMLDSKPQNGQQQPADHQPTQQPQPAKKENEDLPF